jgi:hypothetical protein
MSHENDKRDEFIRRLYQSGDYSLQEIAQEFNVTKTRIHQIVRIPDLPILEGVIYFFQIEDWVKVGITTDFNQRAPYIWHRYARIRYDCFPKTIWPFERPSHRLIATIQNQKHENEVKLHRLLEDHRISAEYLTALYEVKRQDREWYQYSKRFQDVVDRILQDPTKFLRPDEPVPQKFTRKLTDQSRRTWRKWSAGRSNKR